MNVGDKVLWSLSGGGDKLEGTVEATGYIGAEPVCIVRLLLSSRRIVAFVDELELGESEKKAKRQATVGGKGGEGFTVRRGGALKRMAQNEKVDAR